MSGNLEELKRLFWLISNLALGLNTREADLRVRVKNLEAKIEDGENFR